MCFPDQRHELSFPEGLSAWLTKPRPHARQGGYNTQKGFADLKDMQVATDMYSKLIKWSESSPGGLLA